MQTIAGDVQWKSQENEDGSLNLAGMLCFKAGMIVPVQFVGIKEKEEFAKRKIIVALFQEMYGDLDNQLRDLEACIGRSIPPFIGGDEPIIRCRNIQREIWRRFNGPHPFEILRTWS